MKHNVGGIDRTGRFIIGAILLVAGLAAPVDIIWRVVALVLAAIALVTAAVRYCPANHMLGINTCKDDESEQAHPGPHGPTGPVTH